MKKDIVKDPFFLSQKAIPANPITDKQVIIDLQDTLRANRDRCVGLAANMIGSNKSIIIVAAGPFDIVMVNPVITKKSQPYQTECTAPQKLDIKNLTFGVFFYEINL